MLVESTLPPAPTARPAYRNRLAGGDADRDAAFALRYVAYRAQGHIDANATERFRDAYDDRDNCFTFLLHDEAGDAAAPVGSIRACVHLGRPGWDRLPAEACFGAEIAALTAAGRRVAEMNRFVLRPDRHGSERAAKLALFANASFVADRFDCDDLLAAVRPDHASFYRQLYFEQVADARVYPTVNFPTLLMRLDCRVAWLMLKAHRVFHRCWSTPRDLEADAAIPTLRRVEVP